ncbi:MAG: DUF4235 domain-containing protein [Actinobacteria bacterium]|nr:DUF4235 domain-containing protein [Actinomycetota bacterium]
MRSATWKAFAGLASIAAATAALRGSQALWQQQRGSEPPVNPADPKTSWGEAVAWTAVTGVLVGLARLFARRGAAAVWEKLEGELPPDLQEAV